MKTTRRIIYIFFLIAIIWIGYWAIFPNNSPAWTGFGPYDEEILGSRAKTLWDWLDLLLVPILLALGAWLLSQMDKETEETVEADRQKQNLLNTYFNQMTELLLKHDLRSSNPGDEVRNVGRTRTLSVLRGLDPVRKTEVLQFLYESQLISKEPIIRLTGANLRDAKLDSAVLLSLIHI